MSLLPPLAGSLQVQMQAAIAAGKALSYNNARPMSIYNLPSTDLIIQSNFLQFLTRPSYSSAAFAPPPPPPESNNYLQAPAGNAWLRKCAINSYSTSSRYQRNGERSTSRSAIVRTYARLLSATLRSARQPGFGSLKPRMNIALALQAAHSGPTRSRSLNVASPSNSAPDQEI
jgi:hypothetical protein